MATKSFTEVDDLKKLFEAEAYGSWSAMEGDFLEAASEAERSMIEAEVHLDSLMNDAMEEFFRTSDDTNKKSKDDISSLVRAGESARQTSRGIMSAATAASKKYVAAAVASAKNGFSSSCKKVQPC